MHDCASKFWDLDVLQNYQQMLQNMACERVQPAFCLLAVAMNQPLVIWRRGQW